MRLTRDDLATMAMALREFRDEFPGAGEHPLADQIDALLLVSRRGRFALIDEDEEAT